MPLLLLSQWTKNTQFAGKCSHSTSVSTVVDGLPVETTFASTGMALVPRIPPRLCALQPVENLHLRVAAARLYLLLAAVQSGGAFFFFLDS